jgi:ribonuclease BN (tRNA processing enzyme)
MQLYFVTHAHGDHVFGCRGNYQKNNAVIGNAEISRILLWSFQSHPDHGEVGILGCKICKCDSFQVRFRLAVTRIQEVVLSTNKRIYSRNTALTMDETYSYAY